MKITLLLTILATGGLLLFSGCASRPRSGVSMDKQIVEPSRSRTTAARAPSPRGYYSDGFYDDGFYGDTGLNGGRRASPQY